MFPLKNILTCQLRCLAVVAVFVLAIPVAQGARKILVVEDTNPDLRILTAELTALGIAKEDVVVARSAPEALNIYRSNPRLFGLIISDYNMGHAEENGDALLQAVRQLRGRIGKIRFILRSHNAWKPNELSKFASLGADHVISKSRSLARQLGMREFDSFVSAPERSHLCEGGFLGFLRRLRDWRNARTSS